MQYSMKYIFGFAAAVCFVCSILLSIANVSLAARQEVNRVLDKKMSVLQAAWLVQPGEKKTPAEVDALFQNIRAHVVDLETGLDAEGVDPATFEEDDEPMVPAPANNAGIVAVPRRAKIYEVMDGGKTSMVILPIYGKGLWSTMKGFLALDADLNTVKGLIYYEQAETPGLGGEVNNPRWKKLWPGRKIYDEQGKVALKVRKGPAGPPEQAPHEVDGLSGATLTGRGVTNMLGYWMADQGFGPFLNKFREAHKQGA